jgi:phosphatidylserine/phosphatidylglycerophosphate/cardiolipin synthase-like enzyme
MSTITFQSPLATPLTGVTRVTPSAPVPDLRFKGDPLVWLSMPAAASINAFATGAVAVAQGLSGGIPGNGASPWTLLQLSPLPQMNTAAFKAVPGGLPVQLVLLVGTIGPPPADGDCLVSGAALATAPAGGAFLAFAFQDRLCRDPLSWAEAIAASGACDAGWAQLVTGLAGLPNARNLRLLDALGFPMTDGMVSVTIDSNPPTVVTLTPAMDADTGILVPPASQATVNFTSGLLRIVASGDADTGQFQGNGLQLAAGKRLAQLLDANVWFAPPDAGVQINPWTADNFIEPIQEGTPYFTRLVADLRSAEPDGKVEMAGWAFVKGSQADSTVDWPLMPGDASTTLVNLIKELQGKNVDVRMLVNQFFRFDSTSLDDFPELAPLVFALYASLIPGQALFGLQTDPAGYAIGLIDLVALEIVLASGVTFDLIKSKLEYSQPLMDFFQAQGIDVATWTPYDAAFSDNPLVTQPPHILGSTVDDLSHVGVYHQKYVTVKTSGGNFVSYLGGIDINCDRPDTTIHRARHPFHDVQVRITGPAVGDVISSFEERAKHHSAPIPIPTRGLRPITGTGSHLVQIARTYFKPGASSSTPAFDFAPNGESTTVRTIEAAIAQARDFIYIEDQYFTPPDEYVSALINAAKPNKVTGTSVRALMITMPYQTDQPYGGDRRADVLNALQTAWKSRLFTGTPLRRFLHETPGLTTNLGRMRLATALSAGALTCDLMPLAHIPPPPFWAFIGNELVLVYAPMGGPTGTGPTAYQTMEIARAAPPGWGATLVAHPAKAPVLAVQVPGIYVHAKVMIVDDIFLFAGSSNINRRGLFHDGEMNSFTLPQHLKGDPANPARILRSRLMAEHMGLSPEMGLSLFADPISAIPYFTSRSWYQGAPRQPLSFFGSLPPSIGFGTSDTLGGWLLAQLMPAAMIAAKPDVWPLMVDPTTSLDPSSAKGPGFP